MPRYSVADAKNGLPGLIDSAMAGNEVIITRHGTPVASLNAIEPEARRPSSLDWLRQQRESRPASPISSVEILRQIYEDDL